MPVTSSSRAIRRASASAGRRGPGPARAPARSPRGRFRRAGWTPRSGTPRPGRSGSAPPGRTARDGTPRAPRRAGVRRSAAAASNAGAHSAGVRDEPDALAVVPAARRLQDAGEAEVDDLLHALHDAPPRQRGADPASASRITTLSWAWTSASGPGRTAVPASPRRAGGRWARARGRT